MSNIKPLYHLPAGYSLFQSMLRSFKFLRNPIKFISKSMEKFSDTYSAVLPKNRTLILTQDAAFINYVLRENHTNYEKSELSSNRAALFFGSGLLFSNGGKWLRQRRLIQPGFHHKKILELNAIVIATINKFLEDFPAGNNMDVYPLMHQLAFDIVINSLFEVDIDKKDMAALNETFTDLQYFLIEEINRPLQRFLYPLTGKEKTALKKSAKLRTIIQGIIDKRIAGGKPCNDLLDMLINSRYEDTGESMCNQQIIDEVLVLIFAGHETTANTLSWMLYLLAGHTGTIKKIQQQISVTSITDSVKDDYFNAVINEAMRLYPAAWMTERVALKDDAFGEYSYPKGTIIIPFFYGLHRHKTYWKEETDFLPERFLPENSAVKKMKNFFPFGSGPRMCIGNNFAMAEMSFFLHAFFNKYTIAPTSYIPEMKPLITLRPSSVFLNISKK